METISIAYQHEITLAEVNEALSKRWMVEGAGKDRLVIQEGNNRVYIHLSAEPAAEGYRSKLLIDYFDIPLVKTILEILADTPDCIVDNDFRTRLPGNQFVARIKSDQKWDWRETQ